MVIRTDDDGDNENDDNNDDDDLYCTNMSMLQQQTEFVD